MTKEEIVFYINGIRESIESKLRASANLAKNKCEAGEETYYQRGEQIAYLIACGRLSDLVTEIKAGCGEEEDKRNKALISDCWSDLTGVDSKTRELLRSAIKLGDRNMMEVCAGYMNGIDCASDAVRLLMFWVQDGKQGD